MPKFNGGGLMLFAREDIPPNLIETAATAIEYFCKELNLPNDYY